REMRRTCEVKRCYRLFRFYHMQMTSDAALFVACHANFLGVFNELIKLVGNFGFLAYVVPLRLIYFLIFPFRDVIERKYYFLSPLRLRQFLLLIILPRISS